LTRLPHRRAPPPYSLPHLLRRHRDLGRLLLRLLADEADHLVDLALDLKGRGGRGGGRGEGVSKKRASVFWCDPCAGRPPVSPACAPPSTAGVEKRAQGRAAVPQRGGPTASPPALCRSGMGARFVPASPPLVRADACDRPAAACTHTHRIHVPRRRPWLGKGGGGREGGQHRKAGQVPPPTHRRFKKRSRLVGMPDELVPPPPATRTCPPAGQAAPYRGVPYLVGVGGAMAGRSARAVRVRIRKVARAGASDAGAG
jgi:hypothetical protein